MDSIKYLHREYIRIKGSVFNMSTTSIDWVTWNNMYTMGIREPRYPVPALCLSIRNYGDSWINPISGMEYVWMGGCWHFTGNYPLGMNPMGFLGE